MTPEKSLTILKSKSKSFNKTLNRLIKWDMSKDLTENSESLNITYNLCAVFAWQYGLEFRGKRGGRK